jgi:hypothetical protein
MSQYINLSGPDFKRPESIMQPSSSEMAKICIWINRKWFDKIREKKSGNIGLLTREERLRKLKTSEYSTRIMNALHPTWIAYHVHCNATQFTNTRIILNGILTNYAYSPVNTNGKSTVLCAYGSKYGCRNWIMFEYKPYCCFTPNYTTYFSNLYPFCPDFTS